MYDRMWGYQPLLAGSVVALGSVEKIDFRMNPGLGLPLAPTRTSAPTRSEVSISS